MMPEALFSSNKSKKKMLSAAILFDSLRVNKQGSLTLKVPITTAADDSLEYISLFFKENKT